MDIFLISHFSLIRKSIKSSYKVTVDVAHNVYFGKGSSPYKESPNREIIDVETR